MAAQMMIGQSAYDEWWGKCDRETVSSIEIWHAAYLAASKATALRCVEICQDRNAGTHSNTAFDVGRAIIEEFKL